MKQHKKAAIIGVPMDLGADRRGVDMGPSAIRVTHLTPNIQALGYDVADFGDVDVPIPEQLRPEDPKMKYVRVIDEVCGAVYQSVRRALEDDRLPIVLGGDHSIAMGSVAGVHDHYESRGKSIGLLWVDAHGDMNTPASTISGNVHGMPLSRLLGMWKAAEGDRPRIGSHRTCLVGVRDVDDSEKEMIAQSGVHVFTMKDIDRHGMSKVMDEVLRITTDGTDGVHVSFDIDAMDPSIAPGVGTTRRGGINYREGHLLMELVADSGKLLGLDMVEVNPILDMRNMTAELGSELILSALGKSTL